MGGSGSPTPPPVDRTNRAHSRIRLARGVLYLALAIAYLALMWFVVFPWVDRTFVNRPTL